MVVLPVILDKLWLPDPYILNVRSVKTVKVLKDVQGVHVYSNNTIFISTWMKIELDCSTMFSKFPFDVQECLLDILSYMYEASDLQMQWLPGGLVLDPRIGRQLSNYEYEFTIDDDNASCICYNCFPPNPPCVRARLLLSRKALGHLLATFLPSGLFVAVSWASLFWPADVIPGRTVLLITALLTLVSMHTAVRQSSPDTSYVKAVDVWMIMCIVMALLALFEYLIVLIIKKRRDRAAVRDSAHVTRMVRPKNDPVKEHDRQRCSLPSEERLERAARFFIPAVFLLFNLAYWPYFLKE
ncbi:glycine receptor subunit alpha-4-like [Panulirus ornatus]|uniref:glycine receptor subunit alpha-4-like n=1 Tax=Panulirus ornatus TaxID=150431 RepID=UPI003A896D29